MNNKELMNNLHYAADNFGLLANTAVSSASKVIKRNARPMLATAGRFVDNGMETFLGIKTGVISKPDRTVVRIKSVTKGKGVKVGSKHAKGVKAHMDIVYADDDAVDVKNHAENN